MSKEELQKESTLELVKDGALEYARRGENAEALQALFSGLESDPNFPKERITELVNEVMNSGLKTAPKNKLTEFIKNIT